MKKIIIANFKMNQTAEDTKVYFTKLLCKLANDNIELIVCPPFTSLSIASFFASGTNVKIGAQNVADDDLDVQTGEVSAKMIKNIGADYVIVGHPERRNKFRESNLTINRKVKSALKQGLKCIVCIGESLAEKIASKTAEVLKKQIDECLKGLYENELESVIVAYEPFWTVGTEKTPTTKDIENGVKTIRRCIKDNYSEKAARDVVIVYGGGLNQSNATKLLSAKEIDGAVFGRASLDVDSFVGVINKIK